MISWRSGKLVIATRPPAQHWKLCCAPFSWLGLTEATSKATLSVSADCAWSPMAPRPTSSETRRSRMQSLMIPPVGPITEHCSFRSVFGRLLHMIDHEDLDRAFGDHHDRCDSQEALADGALILHKPSVRF